MVLDLVGAVYTIQISNKVSVLERTVVEFKEMANAGESEVMATD